MSRLASLLSLPGDRLVPRWLPKWLPALVFLAFYLLTTGIGGLYFLSEAGRAGLRAYIGTPVDAVSGDIGSPVYLALLLLPFALAPPFAYLGIRLVQSVVARTGLPRRLSQPHTSRTALFVLAILASAYSLGKLYAADALFPDLLASADYRHNILRRVELFDLLGPAFFLIAYGTIPMLAAIFLIRFERSGRKLSDLLGFLAMFLLFYLIIFSLFSKSHLLVFTVMLVSGVIVARASLWYIPALGVVSLCAFLFAEALLSGRYQTSADLVGAELGPGQAGTTQGELLGTEQGPLEAEPGGTSDGDLVPYLRHFLMNSAFLRMSGALPFYVSVFKDPAERCGIEAHTVRRALQLPPSKCVIPIKVFAAMYPEIRWVTGFAPAPAHVSAYGERGMLWSVIVTAISGLVLGMLGAVAQLGRGPLFVGIGVASCGFAYYLSQLPLIASFTYGHGLIFLMAPVLVLFAVSLLRDSVHSLGSGIDRAGTDAPLADGRPARPPG